MEESKDGQPKWLDGKAESMDLDESGWRIIYELERELEEIYTYKENIWQKRCSERWIVLGDANTGFLHRVANGRRRKCTIHSLEAAGVKFLKQLI
jgi:hypothetical protein